MEPKEPRREDEAVATVQTHYEALTELVSGDALNLVAAMGMLYSHLRAGRPIGETEGDDPDFQTEVRDWVLSRARVQVALLMAVTVWSALEAFVEDVWIEMCTRLEITEEHPLGKEKISLVEVSALTERERYRKIWDRLHPEQGMGIGRYDELLGFVGLRAAVSDVPVRPETRVSHDGTEIDDAWTRRALGELKEVRNVVLHRRGIADLRLERVSGGTFTAGSPVQPSIPQVFDYGSAVHAYAAAIRYSALQTLAPEINTREWEEIQAEGTTGPGDRK